MRTRIAAALALCLLLCGCVLQSAAPFFADKDAVLALGDGERLLRSWSLEKGVWTLAQPDEPPLILRAEGKHYLALQGNDSEPSAVISFVALKDGWLAGQFVERDKPAAYVLARLEGRDLLFSPLMCSELQKKNAAPDNIAYGTSDCTAKNVEDPKAFFASLIGTMPPPDMKLAPEP